MYLPLKEDVFDKLDVNQPRVTNSLFKGKHEVTHGRLYDCSMSKRINLHPKYMFQSDSMQLQSSHSREAVASGCTLTAHYMVRSCFIHKRKLRGSQTKAFIWFLVYCFYSFFLEKCLQIYEQPKCRGRENPYLGDEQTCC